MLRTNNHRWSRFDGQASVDGAYPYSNHDASPMCQDYFDAYARIASISRRFVWARSVHRCALVALGSRTSHGRYPTPMPTLIFDGSSCARAIRV